MFKNNLQKRKLPAGQKVNWNEFKKRNSELKKKRLQKNSNYKIIQISLHLFEEIRRNDCPQEKKQASLKKLKQLLQGKVMDVIKTHDMSRVIQWMLKLGSPDIYDFIINEILDNVVFIAQTKYSSHVLKFAIRFCKATTRRLIFGKLIEQTVQLISSKIASPIMNKIYNKYALFEEKSRMKQALYGEFFKTLNVSKNYNNLKAICDKNNEFKQAILAGTKVNLEKLVDKKWCSKSEITLSVINEYLELCNESDKAELIEHLKPNIAELIKTKEGTTTAMTIVWNSNAKEKKQLVKQLQDQAVIVAKTTEGCMFILWLLDSIDDTVLIRKMLLKKFNENITGLLNDSAGRKVIVYIFDHGRQNSFFTKDSLEKLEEAGTSEFVKKESDVRIAEIQEAFFGNIIDHMTKNPSLWLSNGPISLITITILNHTLDKEYEKEFDSAFHAIAMYLCQTEDVHKDNEKENSESLCIIETSYIHHFLKKTIDVDSKRHDVGLPTLSENILNSLDEQIVMKWVKFNRGCFTLVRMLKTKIPVVKEKILYMLNSSCVHKCLEEQISEGANNLKKKLRKNKNNI